MNDIIVDLNQLQRRIDQVTILKGISAQVKKGDVVALLGKNGAGKTTLIETLLGFSFPSNGHSQLWGEDATSMSAESKQRIGFVPQQSELLPSMNGQDHLNLFKSFRSHWNEELVNRLVMEWLIPLDLRVGKMSVGQQQKLSILLAIAHEPELLILDEPVASLDPVARRQFIEQLIDIAADNERAIIFSSHIVSDMERIANQVWMLQDGTLRYQGGLDELKESVARITLRSSNDLPARLPLEGVISQRVHGRQATVTLGNWSPKRQQQIAQQLDGDVQVEFLSLEDIFLEMNA